MTNRPWSYATHYTCDGCHAELTLERPVNTCPHCGALLDVVYNLCALSRDFSPKDFANRTRSIWRWHELLPLQSERSIVSLGEGDTPLIRSVFAGPNLGLDQLYFKNDTLMPTGSFKDRGMSLAVSFAKELGITRGLTYTSGNAGASFSAYAARAGINAVVLVEYLANPIKQAIIRLYQSTAVELYFQGMDEITQMLERAVRELGIYQFVNFINPVRHEAMKTYAYEIAEAFGWSAPDVMVHPVGTGGGLWGAWKGFRELQHMGWIDKRPRMVAVQPDATGPIVHAFNQGQQLATKHGDSTKTLQQSIAGDSPIQGGGRILRALYESGGFADTVTDAEALEAMLWLGQEGISAEPSAAATLALVAKNVRRGRIQPHERVVCVITGSGLKQPSAIEMATTGAPRPKLNANFAELQSLLQTL